MSADRSLPVSGGHALTSIDINGISSADQDGETGCRLDDPFGRPCHGNVRLVAGTIWNRSSDGNLRPAIAHEVA